MAVENPEAGGDLADAQEVVGAAVNCPESRPACRTGAANQPRNAPISPKGTQGASARFAHSPKAIRRESNRTALSGRASEAKGRGFEFRIARPAKVLELLVILDARRPSLRSVFRLG